MVGVEGAAADAAGAAAVAAGEGGVGSRSASSSETRMSRGSKSAWDARVCSIFCLAVMRQRAVSLQEAAPEPALWCAGRRLEQLLGNGVCQ